MVIARVLVCRSSLRTHLQTAEHRNLLLLLPLPLGLLYFILYEVRKELYMGHSS
jgi:hypothetical protein